MQVTQRRQSVLAHRKTGSLDPVIDPFPKFFPRNTVASPRLAPVPVARQLTRVRTMQEYARQRTNPRSQLFGMDLRQVPDAPVLCRSRGCGQCRSTRGSGRNTASGATWGPLTARSTVGRCRWRFFWGFVLPFPFPFPLPFQCPIELSRSQVTGPVFPAASTTVFPLLAHPAAVCLCFRVPFSRTVKNLPRQPAARGHRAPPLHAGGTGRKKSGNV